MLEIGGLRANLAYALRPSGMNEVKAAVKRLPWAVVMWGLIRDARAGRKVSEGDLVLMTTGAPKKRAWTLAESLEYIDAEFQGYLRYTGLTQSDLCGQRVLELGPGDNFGIALRFLAAGASEVVCLDRFIAWRDADRERALYSALLASLQDAERKALEHIVLSDGTLDMNGRLRTVHGVGIEESQAVLEPDSFNLIVSGAVLEHLNASDAAFSAMDRVLAPSGRMVHTVDLSDHGMFGPPGGTLTFLTVSERVYRRMTRNSGGPNRRLVDYYRAKMAELGYDFDLLITRVLAEGGWSWLPMAKTTLEAGTDYGPVALAEVRRVRERLRPPFQSMSDEELVVVGIVLLARKPRPSEASRRRSSHASRHTAS